MSEEDEVIVEYDINSLHKFTTERTSDYSKNRVIRVYDSFADDLKLTFPPNKFDNDPDDGLSWKALEEHFSRVMRSREQSRTWMQK